jgi:hypothetical protein
MQQQLNKYNLTLGLLDKERRTLVAGKAYEASAITFGEAKEGSMEPHNFLSTASIISTHTRNEKKQDASSVATAKSLAKSVFSIETSTSKVTEDDMEESKDEDSKDKLKKASKEQVTFEGMEMLCRGDSKAMTFNTGEEDKQTAGSESKDNTSRKLEENEFQDSEDDIRRERAALLVRMEEILLALKDSDLDNASHNTPDPHTDNEDGKDYKADDSLANSHDNNLSLSDYDSDVLEVLSGEFNAAHGQKYVEPQNFLQALWYKAGPVVGSMKVMLDLLRTEFEGEVAGLTADLANMPQILIDFLIKEAVENPSNAIAFLNKTAKHLSKFEDKGKDEGENPSALPPDPGDESNIATKTKGTLPSAPLGHPTEGTAETTTTMVEGDKKGLQSLSMATGE